MTRLNAVVDMSNAGRSNNEIAEALGITYGNATQLITKARKNGLLPPKAPKSLHHEIKEEIESSGFSRGYIGSVLEQLSKGQRIWMYQGIHTYECQSVAEYLLELVREEHARVAGD